LAIEWPVAIIPDQPQGSAQPIDVRTETARTLAGRLRAETQGEVLFDAGSRGRYATDASIYQVTPVGVFVPRSARDVRCAIDIARELAVPLLPRGAGTSQCGQTVGAALVIDTSKYLRRIVEIDEEARTATVEPGVVLDQLNAALKPRGLWFPVDVSTSAQATLGGMAGNNSCGSRSIVYGNMVHNVLGITAWMSDGEQLAFGPLAGLSGRAARIASFVRDLAQRHRAEIGTHWPRELRRVAGYNLDIFDPRSVRPYSADHGVNLAHLLVGSEGTLCFTRQLTLRLAEQPRSKVLGVINFPTFHAAMDAAQHIVTLGPSAVELVDRIMIELSLSNPQFRPTIEAALLGRPDAILLVEFSGDDKATLLARLKQLVTLMGDLGLPGSVVELQEEQAQKNLWEVRKAGLNVMMSLKGDGKPVSFIEDCAVPLEHLAAYTAALTEVFARHGTQGTWYAHASVGTLHVRPILDMRRDGAKKMRAIAEEAAELVRKYRGAFSGEHGDGLCRGEWIAWQFGPALTEAFAAIKRELDPINLFSPQRIVDPPRMDDLSLLRFAPPGAPHPYRVQPLEPVLDWSAWDVSNDPISQRISPPGSGGDPAHGFAKAVEMCNNNGHCRKFDAGTMCPSYRVTRDEAHLTRGRANTLRLALSGQLDGGLGSPDVRDALDLCVSCKGCRRECPTGVDMARMKIEFRHRWQAEHGLTLRERLIASLPRWAPLAARVPALVNARDRLPFVRAMVERTLRFSAQRSLPRFRSDTFLRNAPADDAGADVVLLVDTFTNAFEPENAHAAVRVLRAAGHRIAIARGDDRPLCCGRTWLTAGLVDRAREEAQRLLAALLPHVARGAAVVGLEPSCLFSLRDEYLVMDLGSDAERVASRAMLVETLLEDELRAGTHTIPLRPLPHPRALLHGHCHQKAFDALKPARAVLERIPGLAVDVVDSSCCGMAGSFGYEAEHYATSMAMAEAALLPAVRAAAADTIVVASGTSCRHQIADGTRGAGARTAVHPIRVLDRALATR